MKASAFLLLFAATPAAAQFDPFGEAKIVDRSGATVPLDVPLRDASGQAVTLRSLGKGRPILLVPVLHHCPNLCGVTLAGVADAVFAQSAKPGTDFEVVAFGIDPKEGPDAAADDLAQLRARVAPRGLDGFDAVVGPPASIHAVTDAIGYRYAWDPRIGQYAHAAATAVLTPDGRLSGWLAGLAPRPADLAAALARARQGTPGGWEQQLLLLCYHYDPATGRYTPSILGILRLAALATLAGLALLLLRLRRART